MPPRVSVIMPVYNAVTYVRAATQSILNQAFDDFEFLIFDDASTDGSLQMVRELCASERRAMIFQSTENTGYVKHLNHGIQIAKGEFIARMDADDVAHPDRLTKQVAFLDRNPGVGIVGSACQIIDAQSTIVGFSARESDPAVLRFQSYFVNPFAHPTVMMRKVIADQVGDYDYSKIPSEDYDYWVRAAHLTDFANLEEALLDYRQHPESISHTHANAQRDNSYATQREYIRQLSGLRVDDGQISFLRGFHKNAFSLPNGRYPELYENLMTIFERFKRKFRPTSRAEARIRRFLFDRLVFLFLNSDAFRGSSYLKYLLRTAAVSPRKALTLVLRRK